MLSSPSYKILHKILTVEICFENQCEMYWKVISFHLIIIIIFIFLHYCQFAVNNLIVLYITWSDWKFYLHLEKQDNWGNKKIQEYNTLQQLPFF